MTPEQYAQVKAAFQTAVDLPADERSDYVRSHFGDDETVVREVESLLEHHFEFTKIIYGPNSDQSSDYLSDDDKPIRWIDDSPQVQYSGAHTPTLTRKLRKLGPAGMVPLSGLVVCIVLTKDFSQRLILIFESSPP